LFWTPFHAVKLSIKPRFDGGVDLIIFDFPDFDRNAHVVNDRSAHSQPYVATYLVELPHPKFLQYL